jgi:hypothetical protein
LATNPPPGPHDCFAHRGAADRTIELAAYDRKRSSVVENGSSPILVHELAHAHGITYTGYSRHQAEVLVDTITHIVLSQAGLDVSGETIPYIAGWGEDGALEAIGRYAQTIDTIARKLEAVVIGEGDKPTIDLPAEQAHAA